MEIIVIPYFAISCVIGWVIFSPFSAIEDLDDWTFAKVEIVDLLAIFLPIGLLLALSNQIIPFGKTPTVIVVIIASSIFLFAIFSFFVSLFVFAKLDNLAASKRMATIGILIPMGSILTLAWIAIPVVFYASYGFLAAPITFAMMPLTIVLRILSAWVCQTKTNP
ncbi:MAG: hypothetical protein AAF939_04330 [Planctomycetota bacterium]